MGVTKTLRILLTIFLSTACIQNVRLFGVYDVRWPFLAEIHTAPLKCCLLVYYRRSEHCAMHQQRKPCSWQVWRLWFYQPIFLQNHCCLQGSAKYSPTSSYVSPTIRQNVVLVVFVVNETYVD